MLVHVYLQKASSQSSAVKASEFDFECTPPPPEPTPKDPFDLSLADTADFARALTSLREKQEAKNANESSKNEKTVKKVRGKKTQNESKAMEAAVESTDEDITKTGADSHTTRSGNAEGKPAKPTKKGGRPKKSSKIDNAVANEAVSDSAHESASNVGHAQDSGTKDEETVPETESVASQDEGKKKRKITKSRKTKNNSDDNTNKTESDAESFTSEASEPGGKKPKRTNKHRSSKTQKKGKTLDKKSENTVDDVENTPTDKSTETVKRDEYHADIPSHKNSILLDDVTPMQVNKRRGRTKLTVSPPSAHISLCEIDINAGTNGDDTVIKDISASSQQDEGMYRVAQLHFIEYCPR